MVRKKEVVQPIMAKPLPTQKKDETEKEVTNLVSNFIETDVTKSVPKKKKQFVTVTKNLIIGKKKITADFTNNNKVRPNYNLSEETVEIIDEIAEILGYKKAEFLDIYLKGTLTKCLKQLKK